MIPELRDLRNAIDQALDCLEPLVPVLELWTASQNTARETQEHAPEPSQPPVPAEAPSPHDGPPTPVVGLFDPLPPRKPAPPRSGNGATTTGCVRCGTPVEQPQRGARRKFCSGACRAKAKAERVAQREADPGLELLPDRVERPFTMFEYQDDFRSDAELLRPPRLSWELEERAAP